MSPQSPALLDVAALERAIIERIGERVISLSYLQHCESTNSECLQRSQHGAVVIAEQQTAGRGRRGKVWHSPASQNIYCSIGVHKTINAEYLGLISLQVGVCVAEVLHRLGYGAVALKWPNDVLLEGKKLGGILTETRALGGNEFFLAIGLGLNSALDDDALEQIDRPAISLKQLDGGVVDRGQLLAHLVSEIYCRVDSLDQAGFTALLESFSRYDLLHGQAVNVHTRHDTLSGLYQGLAPNGQIQVLTDAGLQAFAAAEISLRAQDHAAD